jgi:hypothetical protein
LPRHSLCSRHSRRMESSSRGSTLQSSSEGPQFRPKMIWLRAIRQLSGRILTLEFIPVLGYIDGTYTGPWRKAR